MGTYLKVVSSALTMSSNQDDQEAGPSGLPLEDTLALLGLHMSDSEQEEDPLSCHEVVEDDEQEEPLSCHEVVGDDEQQEEPLSCHEVVGE